MPREICQSYLPSRQKRVPISLISTFAFPDRRNQTVFINLFWGCSLRSTTILLSLQSNWKTSGKLQKSSKIAGWCGLFRFQMLQMLQLSEALEHFRFAYQCLALTACGQLVDSLWTVCSEWTMEDSSRLIQIMATAICILWLAWE